MVLSSVLLGLPTAHAGAGGPIPPEPPVRLKKKDQPRPMADEAKIKQPPKRDPADENPNTEPGQDSARIAERVARRMTESERRLAKKELGDATLELQTDILKDLDLLLKQMREQQAAPSSPSANSSSNRKESSAPRERSSTRSEQAGASPVPRQALGGRAKTNGATGGPANLAEVYKDIWGHLPETLRQEMDQYAREQFMPKYSELIQRYYATISEKGHRKGD